MLNPSQTMEIQGMDVECQPKPNRIKQWLSAVLPVAVALLFVVIVSLILRFVEMQYIGQTNRAYGATERACPTHAVTSQIHRGYLNHEFIVREKYFICEEPEDRVSFWNKLFGVGEAVAADYSAMKIIQSASVLEIAPGETKSFIVGFKNTGSMTWEREARNYISIYTHGPKYRTSRFQDSSWKLREQPSKMDQARVEPGHIGYVTWKFHAPSDIATGWYEETFYLAAEDLLWIPGGQFTVKIYVDSGAGTNYMPTAETVAPEPEPEPAPAPVEPTTDSSNYSGKVLIRSHQSITMNSRQTVQITVGVKNYGDATWTNEKIVLPGATAASSALDNFYHSSWPTQSTLAQFNQTVGPGNLGIFKFILQAPAKPGSYYGSFKLSADDNYVAGAEINIPITVTDDGSYTPTTTTTPTYNLISEPIMRIGLYDLETDLVLTADKSYKVKTSNGMDLGTYSAGQTVTAGYDKTTGEYYFSKAATEYRGQYYLRFEPAGAPAAGGAIVQNVFELVNYEHRPAWNRAYNDNRFRGIIEIRVSETGYPWVINELPMEDYIKGLAETSDYSPTGFQKSLAAAARSYAFHHWENPYKHAKGHFILDATYDQVYRGYSNELRIPRFAAAVEATRGMIVHYQDEAVFTPYYSRSDGRTRSYKEVWGIYNGQDYGWLQSVPAPYDAKNNNTLWGHGVGMACTDAIGMANDGYGWEEILKHYYTNISLKKLW